MLKFKVYSNKNYLIFVQSSTHIAKLKNLSKLALLNEENLYEEFKLEEIKDEEQLPIELFQEIETELCDHILHTAEGDETDGAIDFIKQILENIKLEIDSLVQNNNKNIFKHFK